VTDPVPFLPPSQAMPHCCHCGGPITGTGYAGRPWPGRPAATYCCYGCLSLGEQERQLAAPPAPATDSPGRGAGAVGWRLGLGILVVGQSMIFGLALNLHDDVPPAARWFTQSLILLGTLVVVALLGPPLFRTAWLELRSGRLTIEALFLLTLAGAMAASLQAFLTGRGAIYFEVVSVLLVVYSLGKLIGARSRAAALAGARAWAGQLDTCRLTDAHGRTRIIPVADVRPGDLVEVNPGETFAVDGVIRAGTGFVSEAAVSGEPFPVVRRPGDRVLAGSASHDATFTVEATTAGQTRHIDRLLAVVAEARDKPLSLQGRADALGRWFLPLVVVTALGTFAYWGFLAPGADWEVGLFNALSVLLVACPCVIGLATPIVVWSALGRLAERGLIVRSAGAVERLAEVDRVLLDKTGTLTDDSFVLLDVVTTATGAARAELLGWLATVQQRSSHPVARAFARLPKPFPPGQEPQVVGFRAVPGCGIEAELRVNGVRHELRAGTPPWIATTCRTPASPDLTDRLKATGHRIDVALDGELAAAAVLSERLRDSTPAMLRGFGRLGLPVEVLTGDTAERAAAVGLNVPTRSGLLPDQKRAVVEAVTAAGGRPLFLGDGINDAAALATAHAGIALASGTDLAVAAADLTLYHSDLRVLPWAVALSREAVRAVRRNLRRAVTYNLVGVTLAACGLLHPVVAAVLMVLSSLSLVFSSTRVGVAACPCDEPEPSPVHGERESSPSSGGREPSVASVARPGPLLTPRRKAVLHGLAFALQGVAVLLLLEAARAPLPAVLVLGGFALAGHLLARAWLRWDAIPHTLDMCFGMLTLGNLGMLLGWWADQGFAPLHDHGCRECVETMRDGVIRSPGMWAGMLLLANAAMLGLLRHRNHGGTRHELAMYTGGNLGMVVGMIAGGWCAAQLETASVAVGFAASSLGMAVGMIGGMLAGTAAVEHLLGLFRWLAVLGRYPDRVGRVTG